MAAVLAAGLAVLGCREREWQSSEAEQKAQSQAEFKAADRRVADGIIYLDNGQCMDARRAPKPWVRVPSTTEVYPSSLLTFAIPLESLGRPSRAFKDSDGRPEVSVTSLSVSVGASPDSDNSLWPIAKPLRVRRLLEEGYLNEETAWRTGTPAGLRMYRTPGARPQDWSLVGDDPRTQCETSFGVVSLLHFVKCRVAVPETAAAAFFDFPAGEPDDIPPLVEAARALARRLTTACPAPSKTAKLSPQDAD
ncbi:hypothetical protein [Phenylobacterium zucineum]|nr:hypothetical protein [Phenylobacterium zucineum]